MLRELDAARAETEAMLSSQRRFVADASHELRTPLTSVLANLELLADGLHGEQGEAARSALRSSQRMRRLVADLLLLARTDVGRVVAHEPYALAQIVVEAAAELGPVSDAHDIELDVQPVTVDGARDELHRLTINLIENALRHTPPGSAIRVSTRASGERALLVVEDDGPGVAPELAPNLFERFVRGVRRPWRLIRVGPCDRQGGRRVPRRGALPCRTSPRTALASWSSCRRLMDSATPQRPRAAPSAAA